jgi:hypothetical protein
MSDSQILLASAELECIDCGLTIHVGDAVVLGIFGWVHPTCGELEREFGR